MNSQILDTKAFAQAIGRSPSRARTILREQLQPLSFRRGKCWCILAVDMPKALRRVGRVEVTTPTTAKGGE